MSTLLVPQEGAWISDYVNVNSKGLEPRGKNVIHRVDLHCQSGGSDKVYIFTISQDDEKFYVDAFYGRRGSWLSKNPIKEVTSEYDAMKVLDSQKSMKIRKGYDFVGRYGGQANELSNKATFEERIVWPMGAQPLKEGKKKDEIIESDDWVSEEKVDGVRMTVHLTPKGLRYFGRSGSKDNPEVPIEYTYALAHTHNIQIPDAYIGTIIDIEVHAVGMTHEEISGHLQAQDGRDNSFMYFKVFDLIQESGLDLVSLEWKFRRMKLTKLFNELAVVFGSANVSKKVKYPFIDETNMFDNGLFRLAKYTIKDKVAFHDAIVAAGGEGTMWKHINGKYKEGAKPANNWYKWKKQESADVVIVGFTAGKGKYDGQIGAVRYAEYLTEEEIKTLGIKAKHSEHMYKDGQDYYLVEIGQCSGMTDEQRLDFTNNQMDYLNRVIEVEYFDRTKKGSLQHPRFIMMRDDKEPKDCLYVNQSGVKTQVSE